VGDSERPCGACGEASGAGDESANCQQRQSDDHACDRRSAAIRGIGKEEVPQGPQYAGAIWHYPDHSHRPKREEKNSCEDAPPRLHVHRVRQVIDGTPRVDELRDAGFAIEVKPGTPG